MLGRSVSPVQGQGQAEGKPPLPPPMPGSIFDAVTR